MSFSLLQFFKDRSMDQEGKTTKQMLQAPRGAVYVWCNNYIGYPTRLSKALSRSDLSIISPRSLNSQIICGHYPVIVIDHAAEISDEQRDLLKACTKAREVRGMDG